MSFPFEDSPILLTGGTGHTGRRVARRLLDRGARLRCLLNTPGRRSRLPDHPRLEIVSGSAESAADLARATEGVDAVVHLAHIRFARILIEALAARAAPVRLIVTSSTRLLSRYPSEIREAVREGEAIIQSAPDRIRWTILRPSMIFGGPSDNNLERLAAALRRSRFFPIFGNGQNLVQPVFVWDLVSAIESCLDRPETVGRAYTLAGPQAFSYRTMVEAVARASGCKPPIFVRLPRGPSLAAARILKKIWRRSPLNPEMIERFGEDRAFDISPARRDFGFEPIPFEDALERKFRREV